MNILLAPDKFKGCLAAGDVAHAIARGVELSLPGARIDLCPMADGGEGTVQALVAATHGQIIHRRVTGPLPEMRVDAPFGLLDDGKTAVIEMAAASGLALLQPSERNPLTTTTFGTGQLMMAAAEMGAQTIILGIGGSATNDGGIGCLQACGLPILLQNGQPVCPTEPLTAHDLSSILYIKHGRGSPLERCKIVVACDVANPLFGPNGAAAVYGPQKGATPEQVHQLDDDLRELAIRTDKLSVATVPGAGAAGGLGFGMAAYLNAQLRSGIDIVMEAVNFPRRLADADLCLTGEGRLDGSSLSGKTTIGVAQAAQRARVPCIALVGSIGPGVEAAADKGLTAWFSICDHPMTLDEAVARCPDLLASSAANVLNLYRAALTHKDTAKL